MFKRILLPMDLDASTSKSLLDQILKSAESFGADIHIVYVAPSPQFGMPIVASFFPADTLESMSASVLPTAEKHLAKFVKDNVGASKNVVSKVLQGKAYEEIIGYARKNEIDCIAIMAGTSSDKHPWLLGTTADKVVRHADCSVIVWRQ